MKRKYPEVDLHKLIATWTVKEWNGFLTKCLNNLDIEKLKATRYSLQAGMARASKLKMNDEKTCNVFIRMVRSIENTMRQILRIKHPLPQDNASGDKIFIGIEAKRKRDLEFEQFLRDSSF